MQKIPIKIRPHVYNELPENWKKVPSKSRPGEFWYVNTRTGEKTWEKPLPDGWTKMQSKSRPGTFWYIHKSGRKSRKRPCLRF